jgi:hypothetical protein
MTWGAKVSQPGVDVSQAADYQLAFSSEWPTLKVFQSASLNLSDISQKQTITSHNLGYPPAFLIETTNTSGLARIAGAGQDEFGDGFYVDDSTLGFDPNLSPAASGSYTGRYFIFTHNLLPNYQAPEFTIGTSALTVGGVQSEGIIASISGQDAITAQPQNLGLNSQAKAPLIHLSMNSNLTFNGTDYSFTVIHALDYTPWFLTFVSIQGSGRYSPFFGGQGNNTLFTSPTFIAQHSVFSNRQGTIIVLKDPFFL